MPSPIHYEQTIFDATGKFVASPISQQTMAEGTNSIDYDLGMLAPGMYFYTISNGASAPASGKFVKQ